MNTKQSAGTAEGDALERLIAAQERIDELRQALEIIAVRDSRDPVADAADKLVALGYWDSNALAAARAAEAKPNAQQATVAAQADEMRADFERNISQHLSPLHLLSLERDAESGRYLDPAVYGAWWGYCNAAATTSSQTAEQVERAVARLRKALTFYADGDHFTRHQPEVWDTVSGEPSNFYEDESATATVEDGSVAKAALDGLYLDDERGLLVGSQVCAAGPDDEKDAARYRKWRGAHLAGMSGAAKFCGSGVIDMLYALGEASSADQVDAAIDAGMSFDVATQQKATPEHIKCTDRMEKGCTCQHIKPHCGCPACEREKA